MGTIMLEIFWQYGIFFDMRVIKDILWETLKTFINANIWSAVLRMTGHAGQEFLFCQFHYFNFQPIKIIRTLVSSNMSQQHRTNITFKYISVCLNHSFSALKQNKVHGCINKANKQLKKFVNYLLFGMDNDKARNTKKSGVLSVQKMLQKTEK